MTLLSDIAESPLINEKYTALAQAARSVGTPQSVIWVLWQVISPSCPLLVFPQTGKPLSLHP